jgi:hypothetical protein
MTMLAAEAFSTFQSVTADIWLVLNKINLGRTIFTIETRHKTCNNAEIRLLIPKATFCVEDLPANEFLYRLRMIRAATLSDIK